MPMISPSECETDILVSVLTDWAWGFLLSQRAHWGCFCSGGCEHLKKKRRGKLQTRCTAGLAIRLEMLTSRAASRQRKPRKPPGTTPGGMGGAWNALRGVKHLFYWLNSVNPAWLNLGHRSHSLSPPAFCRYCPLTYCFPLLFLLMYLSSRFLTGWLELSVPPETCCSPFCHHDRLLNAHLSVRAGFPLYLTLRLYKASLSHHPARKCFFCLSTFWCNCLHPCGK